jgi:uncharacterized protein YfaS (alpha-2-macroglobulin family)
MIRKLACAALAAAALLAACTRTTEVATRPTVAQADPLWSQLISAHSTGAISRRSSIRVTFANAVVPVSRVGTDASGFLTLEPAIKGKVTFKSAKEIVATPASGELAPGTTYKARVNGKGLQGIDPKLGAYEFLVQTLSPNFDVTTHGLSLDPANDERMVLRGTVSTADTEDGAKLEKVLRANLAGASLPIAWTHADLRHDFTVSAIVRADEPRELTLAWDGAPIDVKVSDQQTLEVPGKGDFSVTSAQALETDAGKQVIVQFSEKLDGRQDLKGLVRLTAGEFTSQARGNTLTLYLNPDVVGDVTLSLESALRSASGGKLQGERSFPLSFTSTKPQVRFVGKGVLLPDAERLTVPFEAVSARAVRVTALQVYEDNIPQFLQVNKLDGSQEMGRVGRVLWRKTITLSKPVPGRWTRYDLDVTELMKKHPGGLFQLKLSLAPGDAIWQCPDDGASEERAPPEDPDLRNQEDGDTSDPSNWDYFDEYFEGTSIDWNQRDNPCNGAYYRYGQNIRAQRNLLASNIGLIAKRGQGHKLLVASTALDSSKPLSGVKIDAVNYQNQVLATANTDREGLAELALQSQPFALIATHEGRKGYLRVSKGGALPVSHFDVGGETVIAGLKGYLYGDRGVWRPGDTIYLTFALQDKGRTLPANHPVTLELRNPRNQLVQTLTNTTPVGQFYAFELQTASDAPTGDWTATAHVGGTSFRKTLKVETVMPNRLKIDLQLGDSEVLQSKPLAAALNAQWLSGAAAANLRAAIELTLRPTTTRFTRNSDYVFDDPARTFSGAPLALFDGELDDNGATRFQKNLELPRDVPGMLSATFVTRVFENGGAFSISRETRTIASFDRFVGMRLPKGDVSRDMLITDKKHVVELATLDASGKPVSVDAVQVTLYKIEWKWWWDQNGESLAQYTQSESQAQILDETVATKDGKGQFTFEIKYPDWGRYLVRACDVSGGHCTGRVFFIDWPSWAGNARDQSGPAANILTLTADKEEYKVGETAVVQLPEASQGRALLTLETGSRILEHRWIDATARRVNVPITADMAPNVYVAVTLVQPHAGKTNDRPIRLYGVIPLKVTDPRTRLAPTVTTAAEWKPQGKASIQVAETSGRAMNYTLAVVDEGLLGLTNFKTPNLHGEFYKREALGVATWDLFDDVAGAYGGELDRLLALGGSDAETKVDQEKSKSRFPPVVKFLGPFALRAGEKKSHDITLPQYVGAVRVMLVAGDGSAYGMAEKSVYVRQPLMILPTLPRVVGPGEQITMPVSVFASDASIRNVALSMELDGRFAHDGAKSTTLAFGKPEEKLGFLALKSGSKLGTGKIRVVATSGAHRAEAEIWLEVRSPNVAATRLTRGTIPAGDTWKATVQGFGLEGTQAATLEVSSLPPLNLDGRLDYLIHYPHGCLEQVTSGAFPQVYLPALLDLDEKRRAEVENNVRSGISRLRGFQLPNGGFVYWPGGWAVDYGLAWRDDWGTTYAGHFLLEAERAGFAVPADMKASWLRYQKSAAQRWDANAVHDAASISAGVAEAARYAQAYRLYTLALAQQPDLGAMNRLREGQTLSAGERWLLAAAYRLANQPEAAATLVKGDNLAQLGNTRGAEYTFGSALRDRAIVLQAMTLMGREAEAAKLVDAISAELADGHWHSTQAVAFALVSVARWAQARPPEPFTFEYAAGSARAQKVSGSKAVNTFALPAPAASGTPVSVRNTSGRTLYATVAVRGIAKSGEEDVSAQGLDVDVAYFDASGNALTDVSRITQGSDLVAEITVTNTGKRRQNNLALTQMVPAGWEIRNERLDGGDPLGEKAPVQRRNMSYWWFMPDGTRDQARVEAEYVDIRDDRLMQYFSLRAGDTITFRTRLNAAYLGRYYLPGLSAEAMYDASQQARLKGQWVEVVARK